MAEQDEALTALRVEIDAIDQQLVALISQRARCAQKIAQQKIVAGERTDFYRPEREAQVLRKVHALNDGPLPDETVNRLFREIMSACRSLEAPVKVAFIEHSGSIATRALLHQFGSFVIPVESNDAGHLWQQVLKGHAHYGLIHEPLFRQHVLHKDYQHPEALQLSGELMADDHHFLVLGGRRVPPSGVDHTCVLIDHDGASVPREAFAQFGVTVLGSAEAAHKMVIYFDGHHQQTELTSLLQHLRVAGLRCTMLGSYPAGS